MGDGATSTAHGGFGLQSKMSCRVECNSYRRVVAYRLQYETSTLSPAHIAPRMTCLRTLQFLDNRRWCVITCSSDAWGTYTQDSKARPSSNFIPTRDSTPSSSQCSTYPLHTLESHHLPPPIYPPPESRPRIHVAPVPQPRILAHKVLPPSVHMSIENSRSGVVCLGKFIRCAWGVGKD